MCPVALHFCAWPAAALVANCMIIKLIMERICIQFAACCGWRAEREFSSPGALANSARVIATELGIRVEHCCFASSLKRSKNNQLCRCRAPRETGETGCRVLVRVL